MTARRSELRSGLAETGRHLLSHHGPTEWGRCHAIRVPVDGRTVRLCARCSGIYPGIAAGLLVVGTGTLPVLPWLVVVLPAVALVDWATDRLTSRHGSNAARTATGFALGLGYGMGLYGVVYDDARVTVLLVGAGYAVLAALALGVARDRL